MLGRVLSVEPLEGGVYEMLFSAGLTNPAPGRFCHIAVPGKSLRRPISLASYRDGVAGILFSIRGEGTEALSRFRAGQHIDVLGALGNGFEPGNDRVLLVAGGLGTPPLAYFASEHKGYCRAVAGFRNKELAALVDRLPNAVICTDDGSLGVHGYVHNEAARLLDGETFDRVLACGPHMMMKALAGLCRERGVPLFVSMEEKMGCGIGACLVCACAAGGTYKRVCKDGPVFNAAEVEW